MSRDATLEDFKRIWDLAEQRGSRGVRANRITRMTLHPADAITLRMCYEFMPPAGPVPKAHGTLHAIGSMWGADVYSDSRAEEGIAYVVVEDLKNNTKKQVGRPYPIIPPRTSWERVLDDEAG